MVSHNQSMCLRDADWMVLLGPKPTLDSHGRVVNSGSNNSLGSLSDADGAKDADGGKTKRSRRPSVIRWQGTPVQLAEYSEMAANERADPAAVLLSKHLLPGHGDASRAGADTDGSGGDGDGDGSGVGDGGDGAGGDGGAHGDDQQAMMSRVRTKSRNTEQNPDKSDVGQLTKEEVSVVGA
jgi:hypothetical protein